MRRVLLDPVVDGVCHVEASCSIHGKARCIDEQRVLRAKAAVANTGTLPSSSPSCGSAVLFLARRLLSCQYPDRLAAPRPELGDAARLPSHAVTRSP
jgi:hypothetical protein